MKSDAVIGTWGFLVKEITAVLRQPRLIIGLVLGPFAIMVAFGLGYRGPRPQLRTILVLPDEPAIAQQVDIFAIYRQGLSGVFQLREITHDRAAAMAMLTADDADVVVVVPPDLYALIRAGHQARLSVFYAETDPTSNAWVRYFTAEQTADLNRRILTSVIRQSRAPTTRILEVATEVLATSDALEADIRARDTAGAAARVDQAVATARSLPAGSAEDLEGLGEGLGIQATKQPSTRGSLAALQDDLLLLREDIRRDDTSTALQRLDTVRAEARQVSSLANQINAIPVETLVSPLAADPQNVAPVEPTPVAFYAPGVLALLLQHIAITLGALSGVRDRLLGTLELFRVSPIGAAQILIGKTVGFGLLLTVISLALTYALTTFLDVPLLGQQVYYWIAVGLVIFAAIGLGFALSVLAANETQAVQLSMLVLLASVFFGGFFLPTDLLFPWVRGISYTLPVTYGSINLRDVMLRGATPELTLMIAPIILGLAFYLAAILGLRHQMRRA